jgi:hypothetical protein
VDDIMSATNAASRRDDLAWTLDVAPVIDGDLLPAHPRALLSDPRYHGNVPFWNIDIMVGTTNAEGYTVLPPLEPFEVSGTRMND